MSKVMLYSHPRTIKSNDEKKGFCKVKGKEVDYIIVEEDEVESCLEQGYYETPAEAIAGSEDLEDEDLEDEDLEDEDLEDEDLEDEDLEDEDLEDEDLEDEDLEDEDLEDEDLEDTEGESDEDVETTTQEITLSLNDLEGKTPAEIKEAYTVEELQVLAKACNIKRATRMNEDTLVERLVELIGE